MSATPRRGLTLGDVAGSIRRKISYWAIDESGNPSRKDIEAGKAFTLSAVTELSSIDYERLFRGVPEHDGEVHFSTLYHVDPEICVRLMTDLGNENILILSLTVRKRSKNVRSVRGIPRDELYLYALLKRILDAIQLVDLSDMVVVTFDRTRQFREDMCELMWTDRCVLIMDDSKARRLIQIADLSASSIGKSELPGEFRDERFLDAIRHKTVRIVELGGCTQQPPSPPYDTTDSDYKKPRPMRSQPLFQQRGEKSGKSTDIGCSDGTDRRMVRIVELGGCTQQPPSPPYDTTDSDYKKSRPRSVMRRIFRKRGRK